MPTLPAELYYAEIEASTAMLAVVVDSADPDLTVPTCPDWTVSQLATHLGRAQRWAAEIVRARSDKFIEFRSVPDGKLPADEAERGRWLTTGATRLIDALRDAGDEQVWAFGTMNPASFWARRMSHEVMVHACDAQIAIGAEVAMPAELAADAIDEWLTVMSPLLAGQPDRRLTALPPGHGLRVRATDPGLAVPGEWLITHADGAGLRVSQDSGEGPGEEPGQDPGEADATMSGPAASVFLALLRRPSATDEPVQITGSQALVTAWLDQTPF